MTNAQRIRLRLSQLRQADYADNRIALVTCPEELTCP